MGAPTLACSLVPILWAVTAPAIAGAAPAIPVGSLKVRLQEVTVGLASDGQLAPTDMVSIGDGTGRRLICTLGGVVRLVNSDGNLLDSPTTPYLSVASLTSSQYGATALAVHPNFSANGRIYQIISEPVGVAPDFGVGGSAPSVLVEWIADNPSSNTPLFQRRDIMRVAQPSTGHNLADIAFGPDGFLYISSGDGGGAGPARQRAQDSSSIYGTVLRIDPVNSSGPGLATSANGRYGIPTDNFGATHSGGLEEVFAIGFRSPYRFNFDSLSGRLYLGDVGALLVEEVNLIVNGGNYGWGRFQGAALFDGTIALAPNTAHKPPAFEYSHLTDGETVVGGFIYRGSLIPELKGKYIFADFGRLFADGQPGTPTLPARLLYADVDPDGRILKLTSAHSPRLGVFTNGSWFLDRDSDFQFNPATELTGWGSPGDTPVPGDWNGDGVTDLGAFSGGT